MKAAPVAIDDPKAIFCINQLKVIMDEGGWFSLAQLAKRTGYPEASVSARLRDLRKPEYGRYNVMRRPFKGIFQYQMSRQGKFEFFDDAHWQVRHRCQYCGGKGYRTGGLATVKRGGGTK